MVNFGRFILNTSGQVYNIPQDITVDTIRTYFHNGTGVMSNPMMVNGVAYIYSSLALTEMKSCLVSDIQLAFLPINPKFSSILGKPFIFEKGYLVSNFKDTEKNYMFLINVMLAKPKSRGEIKLASAIPVDKPILDPKYFSHPDVIKIIADGKLTVAFYSILNICFKILIDECFMY